MRIWSPYRNGGVRWLRGNLHAHSEDSDGPFSPQDLIHQYAARGYQFLSITDHDLCADLSRLDSCGMTLIPGNEITAEGPHIVHVGVQSLVKPGANRQKVLDAIGAQNGLAIMSHPNWEPDFNHCPQETLMNLNGYAGIEIYNGVVSWLEGNPLATDRWDRLLAAGRRVWGFANDDCHIAEDIGIAWNMLQAPELPPETGSIIEALKSGRFYASTGVTIESISALGNAVHIRTANAERISVYSDYGFRRAWVNAPETTFTVDADALFTYFRFECIGRHDERAWTQPFFLMNGE